MKQNLAIACMSIGAAIIGWALRGMIPHELPPRLYPPEKIQGMCYSTNATPGAGYGYRPFTNLAEQDCHARDGDIYCERNVTLKCDPVEPDARWTETEKFLAALPKDERCKFDPQCVNGKPVTPASQYRTEAANE